MIIREESVGCRRRECPFGLLGVIKGRKSCPAFPPLCLKAESHKAGPTVRCDERARPAAAACPRA